MSRQTPGLGTLHAPGLYFPRVYQARGIAWDGASDDTTALQNNLAAAAALGYTWVEVPPGTGVMSAPLSPGQSDLSLAGAGLDGSRLMWKAGASFNQGGFWSPADAWNQERNHLQDLTLDPNGWNTPAWSANTTAAVLGSRSQFVRVGFCNRPTSSGTLPSWLVLCQAHDAAMLDCYLHDDIWVQVAPGTALGPAGAKTVSAASTTGIAVNGYAVVDPSVTAWLGTAVTATGSQTVKIGTLRPHKWVNGGNNPAVQGLFVGQQVTFGSTAGGDLETIPLTAVDYVNGTVTATFGHTHLLNAPVLYSGATETCQITAVVANTSFSITTQLAHSGQVAIVILPDVADAVAVGNPDSYRIASGFQFRGNTGVRLGLDLFGAASGNDGLIAHNAQYQAISGLTLTNSYRWRVVHNECDLSFAGLPPIQTAAIAPIFCGFFWLANGAAGSPYTDHVVAGNTFNGGAFGIYAVPNGSIVLRGGVIADNVIDSPALCGIVIANADTINEHDNDIINHNAANATALPSWLGGGTVTGVLMSGTQVNTSVHHDNIRDNRGTPQGQGGVRNAATNTAGTVLIEACNVQGIAGTNKAVQWASATAPPIVRGNLGFNPQMGAITNTPTTAPASGTTNKYQNLSGCDLEVTITGGTVSNVTVYDTSNANGVTKATATGCVFLLPAYASYSVTYTVAPTVAYSGL